MDSILIEGNDENSACLRTIIRDVSELVKAEKALQD